MDGLHLTYCLNVHPGETWAENLSAITRYALPVRDSVSAGRPFGLGLRLGNKAATQLSAATGIRAFKRYMQENNLYAFTINGFPFGRFHRTRVKEDVYRPDWQTARRRNYTIRLAGILAQLLPDGTEGSISTLPGSFRKWSDTPQAGTAIIENLMDVVSTLHSIHNRTGRLIHLGLEPEPACYLETTGEVIEFFETCLDGKGAKYLAGIIGCSRRMAQKLIRLHLGVCFDTCHLALQFEDIAASIRRFTSAGIRISKVQISAALKARNGCPLPELKPFTDNVYLHQTVIRDRTGRLEAFTDLPDALAEKRDGISGEWRIHFHVPLYYKGTARLGSTSDLITKDFFKAARAATSHFEIETYTFNVLPPALRSSGIVASISSEFRWVKQRLG